jgi:hypothetical protein
MRRVFLLISSPGILPGPEVHSMPKLTSIKDHRLMSAASRTGSGDKVYTLIEYKRTPATMVDTKPTMNDVSTAHLSPLVVFSRDQSSGNGNAKINTSVATVNALVPVHLCCQILLLYGRITSLMVCCLQ